MKNSRKLALALPLAAVGVAAAIYYRKPLLSAAGTLIEKSGGLAHSIGPAVSSIGSKIGGAAAGGGILSSMLSRGPGVMIAGGLLTYALKRWGKNSYKA